MDMRVFRWYGGVVVCVKRSEEGEVRLEVISSREGRKFGDGRERVLVRAPSPSHHSIDLTLSNNRACDSSDLTADMSEAITVQR